jgi:hypothetical protein
MAGQLFGSGIPRIADLCQFLYILIMSTKTIDDVHPKAVMTPDEVARWNALPPGEQLARLRAAIRRGIESGPSDLTMEQIWARIRARHPDASLWAVGGSCRS